MLVTLNEGFLRAANRNSSKFLILLIRILNQNNISALNEKNKYLFWSVFFTFFLRLQIYEAFAVIFWQFASYVFSIWDLFVCSPCKEYYNILHV